MESITEIHHAHHVVFGDKVGKALGEGASADAGCKA